MGSKWEENGVKVSFKSKKLNIQASMMLDWRKIKILLVLVIVVMIIWISSTSTEMQEFLINLLIGIIQIILTE
jgi:hypothetical protein